MIYIGVKWKIGINEEFLSNVRAIYTVERVDGNAELPKELNQDVGAWILFNIYVNYISDEVRNINNSGPVLKKRQYVVFFQMIALREQFFLGGYRKHGKVLKRFVVKKLLVCKKGTTKYGNGRRTHNGQYLSDIKYIKYVGERWFITGIGKIGESDN